MRNFNHTCKFSRLTINFSEVWPRQILDLGNRFNLTICLQNVLKTSLQDDLRVSWRRSCKMSWRRLDNVLKTSWRRLKDVLKTYGQDDYIGLDQDENIYLVHLWGKKMKKMVMQSWVCQWLVKNSLYTSQSI